jgi:type I restriction enzyme M protein
MLKGLKINDLPREIINVLSEDLLARFTDQPLIDRYDIYQRLMDYWRETMQDDVYLIAGDGWIEAAKPRGIVEDKERKIKETPDLIISRRKYKMDLVPPALVAARYFAEEQAAIDALQIEHDNAARELEEFIEEKSGDEGLLVDAINEKGKVTMPGVKEQLKATKTEEDSKEEREALTHCLELMEAERKAGSTVTEAQTALDENVLAKYATLSEDESKTLVIDNKWLASVHSAIDGEVQRVMQHLAERVKELEQRYDPPMAVLEGKVETLGAKVEAHLKKMGLMWT